MSRPLLFLMTASLLACSGPFVVFPGGALDGPVAKTPTSFAFANEVGTIQLETNPADPYSVNIACVAVGDTLYISAGDSKTQWVENMEADPAVRLQIEGLIYELKATRVVNDAEMQAFANAWTSNHAWARDPTKLDEAWVYRLSAR